MSNFTVPIITIIDSNGDVLVGAKLKFYLAGTSTLATIYSDSGLLVVKANPVVTNAAGQAGPIWLDPDNAYKVRAEKADSTLLWESDDVGALRIETLAAGFRVEEIAASPTSFGAIGDGVADETAAVQSAIDAATGTVDLLGRRYRVDGASATNALTFRPGIRLINGTLDFRGAAVNGIGLVGTFEAALALTATTEPGGSTVTVADTLSLNPGDWLRISSDKTVHSVATIGESHRIKTVDSSTAITLHERVRGQYATGDNAVIEKYATDAGAPESLASSRILIEDVRFYGSVANDKALLNFSNLENVTVRNCTFEDCTRGGVSFDTIVNGSVLGCNFHNDAPEANDLHVLVQGASTGIIVRDCYFGGSRIGIGLGDPSADLGGVSTDIDIHNCRFSGYTLAAIDSSADVFGVTISNCDFSSESNITSLEIKSLGNLVTGCRFQAGAALIMTNSITEAFPYAGGTLPVAGRGDNGLIFSDNTVINSLSNKSVYLINSTTGAVRPMTGIVISGNRFMNGSSAADATPVYIKIDESGAVVDQVNISNNIINLYETAVNCEVLEGHLKDVMISNNNISLVLTSGRVAITLDASAADGSISGVNINNNVIRAESSLLANGVYNLSSSNNFYGGSQTDTITLVDVERARFCADKVRCATKDGFDISGTNTVDIIDCDIDVSIDCIRVDGALTGKIDGCHMVSSTTAGGSSITTTANGVLTASISNCDMLADNVNSRALDLDLGTFEGDIHNCTIKANKEIIKIGNYLGGSITDNSIRHGVNIGTTPGSCIDVNTYNSYRISNNRIVPSAHCTCITTRHVYNAAREAFSFEIDNNLCSQERGPNNSVEGIAVFENDNTTVLGTDVAVDKFIVDNYSISGNRVPSFRRFGIMIDQEDSKARWHGGRISNNVIHQTKSVLAATTGAGLYWITSDGGCRVCIISDNTFDNIKGHVMRFAGTGPDDGTFKPTLSQFYVTNNMLRHIPTAASGFHGMRFEIFDVGSNPTHLLHLTAFFIENNIFINGDFNVQSEPGVTVDIDQGQECTLQNNHFSNPGGVTLVPQGQGLITSSHDLDSGAFTNEKTDNYTPVNTDRVHAYRPNSLTHTAT